MAKGGRPSKFSEETIKKAEDYLENYRQHGDLLPTVEGLALFLGVHRDTVYIWSKQNEEFSDILKKLMTLQAKILIEGGLLNKFSPTLVRFLLSAKHGYVEKTEIEEKKVLVLDEEDSE